MASSSTAAATHRVVLGVTGSVAAVKGPRLALALAKAGCQVRVVLTARGEHFWRLAETYDPESWKAVGEVPGAIHPCSAEQVARLLRAGGADGEVQAVLRDQDEWDAYATVKKDPVLHIEVSAQCGGGQATTEQVRRSFGAGPRASWSPPSRLTPWGSLPTACATTC